MNGNLDGCQWAAGVTMDVAVGGLSYDEEFFWLVDQQARFREQNKRRDKEVRDLKARRQGRVAAKTGSRRASRL